MCELLYLRGGQGTSWWSLLKKCKKVAQKWSKVLKTGRNSIFGVPMDIFSGFIQQYSPKAEEETEF